MTRITARLRDALAEIFPAKDSTDNLQMSDGIGNKVDTPKLVVNESTSALAYLKGIISEQPLVFGGGIAGRTITDVSLASPIGDNTDAFEVLMDARGKGVVA